jgi:hypothetical protein
MKRPDRETLCRMYEDEGLSMLEVARRLEVCPATVKRWLAWDGIAERQFHVPDGLRPEIAARYQAGEGLVALGKAYGFSPTSIAKACESIGITRRPAKLAPFPVREDAFDTVTEESAYWIGFLMADGCVSRSRWGVGKISLTLKADDAGHVERFRGFLGARNKISYSEHRAGFGEKKSYRSAHLVVTSNRLAEVLTGYGVTPRKSLTARVIGLEMNRDYWRGVVDGDGCISFINSRRKSRPYPQVGLIGSGDTVEQFLAFVRTVCPRCKAAPHHRGNTYSVALSDYQAYRVVEALYSGCSIALPRKEVIALQVLDKPIVMRIGKWDGITVEDLDEMWVAGGGNWSLAAEKIGSTVASVYVMYYRLKRTTN